MTTEDAGPGTPLVQPARMEDSAALAALYRANRRVRRAVRTGCDEDFVTTAGGSHGSQRFSGLASGAVEHVLPECLGVHGLDRMGAATLVDNLASLAVLRRTGFTLVGCAAGYLRIGGMARSLAVPTAVRRRRTIPNDGAQLGEDAADVGLDPVVCERDG